MPLDPYMEQEGFDYAAFYASEYEAFVSDGTTFGLPLDVSGSYLCFG